MSAPALARVALVGFGGTIGAVGRDRLDLSSYHETGLRLGVTHLLEEIPELAGMAVIETVDVRRGSSTAITSEDWARLVAVIEDLFGSADGVVVTHGTNTIEETAYFLDLCLAAAGPVVLVGAMRPPTALSSDAPLNLLRAVQVAASPKAAQLGVVVVAGDRVLAARDVVKADSQSVEAFASPGPGAVGIVEPDGRVVIDRVPEHRLPRFPLDQYAGLPRVDVVVTHVGADGALIDAAVTAGAKGIVSAGAGAGRATPGEEDALRRAAAAGVVVCLSSRVAAGSVVPTPETTAAGFVSSRSLVAWKARVLLALALTTTSDPAEIQALFDLA